MVSDAITGIYGLSYGHLRNVSSRFIRQPGKQCRTLEVLEEHSDQPLGGPQRRELLGCDPHMSSDRPDGPSVRCSLDGTVPSPRLE